ncbi:MAG: cold-shock protein [Rickettsiales bacterium]|jgi:CspA family cold shock protein|nr:cold-shock protein [Rickettsiales bacterium]
MATGVVKWFNPAKRFGFIKPDDGGQDVFVHITALEQAGLSMLDENQKVQYDLADSKGKTSAVNLKLI